MNKVSLKKIRHLQLGGNIWQTLGNQQLQGATGGFGQYLLYNQSTSPITPPYNNKAYPNPIASQGSLNSTPLSTNFNPQIQQQFQKQQESQVQANVDQYKQKQWQNTANIVQGINKAGSILSTSGDPTLMKIGAFASPVASLYETAKNWNTLNKGQRVGRLAGISNNVFGVANQLLPQTEGNPFNSKAAQGVAQTVAAINPVAGGIVQAGLFATNMLDNAFGKRTHSFTVNQDTLSQVGSDYNDTTEDIYKAKEKSGKKYSIFNSGGRHRANRFIDATNAKQNIMTDISDNARRILAQSSDANATRFNMAQNGGINQQYLRVAKIGAKLPKIKEKIEWRPVITIDEPIKLEKGGKTTRTLEQLIAYAKEQNPRFIQRMSEPLRYITLPNGQKATHKMSWGTNDFGNGEQPFIYSEIQEDDNGELKDFGKDAMKRAIQKKNYLLVNNPEEAELFTNSEDLEHGYKSGWKDFFMPFYKNGGNVTIQVTVIKEKPEEEEAKNVIPEGALHAHKHHMDNAENLTQKGIPVVDDKGEQLAEIEKDEIILHLKLTNKLEELQEKYEKASKTEQDKLAIEAGKLLVEEILHNTIDNTNLIDKCEKGGKINGSI